MAIPILTSVHGKRLGMSAEGAGSRLIFDGEALAKTQVDFVSAGSALTLTVDSHAGKVIKLDTAAGSTVTLPAATGTGAVYEFVVSVLATSNSHVIKVANSTDAMQGIILTADDTGTSVEWYAAVAGTSDTITLNRTTTGSVTVGEKIKITDFASGRFQVEGVISNTGSSATPFSATV